MHNNVSYGTWYLVPGYLAPGAPGTRVPGTISYLLGVLCYLFPSLPLSYE